MSSEIGTNGVVCAQCHPDAAVVDQCIRNPLEGEPPAADEPRMTTLSYVHQERRGVALASGKR